MKKIFTHENRLIVFNMKNLLDEKGIDCIVTNEFSGGGVGDLAPFEIWPELWVVDESESAAAEDFVKQVEQGNDEDIFCPHCGAENGSYFQICWQCNKELIANY